MGDSVYDEVEIEDMEFNKVFECLMPMMLAPLLLILPSTCSAGGGAGC